MKSNADLVDEFCTTLWLEEGLAQATLQAYRSDLQQLAHWLEQQFSETLLQTSSEHLRNHVHNLLELKPSSLNRKLSSYKRFYLWLNTTQQRADNPCAQLQSAKRGLRIPKTLSEQQVLALLAAPDVNHAAGQRDKAMLEFMYASGLRVSELVNMPLRAVDLNVGAVKVLGKGDPARLLEKYQAAGPAGRHRNTGKPACAAPCICHPFN